jgi:hypothetical protein
MRPNDDAVSPVIGVLLLVGVTAALGATVWLISYNLSSHNPGVAPKVILVQDNNQDQLKAPRSDSADWSTLTLVANTHLHFRLNGQASPSTLDLPADRAIAASSVQDGIDAADYLDFCAVGGVATNVQVQVSYVDPDGRASAVLQQLTFPVVVAC